MAHAYFDKGILVKAVISGTYQLESIRNQHIFNALGYKPLFQERVPTWRAFQKGLRDCSHQSGPQRRKNLQCGRAQRGWSLAWPHSHAFLPGLSLLDISVAQVTPGSLECLGISFPRPQFRKTTYQVARLCCTQSKNTENRQACSGHNGWLVQKAAEGH